jgi:hypothetical protein
LLQAAWAKKEPQAFDLRHRFEIIFFKTAGHAGLKG